MQKLSEFYAFMRERESIRVRRLNGLPQSGWTDDEIFKNFSFTNVKRSHDRTTVLLSRIYAEHADAPPAIKLLNCTLYRFFGTIETARHIGWIPTWDSTQKSRLTRMGILDELRFTSAYIVPNAGLSCPKFEIVNRVADELWSRMEYIVPGRDWSWEAMCDQLTEIFAIGEFMAKEIILDYVIAINQTPVDWQTWTPVGPGGRKGASRVEYGIKMKIPVAEALAIIKRIYAARDESGYWSRELVYDDRLDTHYRLPELDLTDIQFQCCEFEKYEKKRLDGGNPKRRFHPTEDEVTCTQR